MINIAIIGMGRMGITHFPILNSHPNVNICAVADPALMINSFFKKYLSSVNIYKDYNNLLKQERVDAVIICTPPSMHYEIIKKLSLKKIHIFVEKPFTANHLEALELSQIYENRELINQVGYVNRFNSIFTFLKSKIEKNVFGNIIEIKSLMNSATVIKPNKEKNWRGNIKSGGGVVFEMASHSIDLINFFIGSPNRVIGSKLSKVFSENVDDIVSSTLLYDDDKYGLINVNWSDTSFRKPSNRIEVQGSKGKAIADQYSIKIFLDNPNSREKLRAGWNTSYITDVFENVPYYLRGNEFTSQLYCFIDSILNKTHSKYACTFYDGYKTLKVIDQIFLDSSINNRI